MDNLNKDPHTYFDDYNRILEDLVREEADAERNSKLRSVDVTNNADCISFSASASSTPSISASSTSNRRTGAESSCKSSNTNIKNSNNPLMVYEYESYSNKFNFKGTTGFEDVKDMMAKDEASQSASSVIAMSSNPIFKQTDIYNHYLNEKCHAHFNSICHECPKRGFANFAYDEDFECAELNKTSNVDDSSHDFHSSDDTVDDIISVCSQTSSAYSVNSEGTATSNKKRSSDEELKQKALSASFAEISQRCHCNQACCETLTCKQVTYISIVL